MSSSYDSLRNGWTFVRLKGCWLEGVSLLPHSPARTGNWLLFCQKARYILVVFLLSYWENRKKKRKSYMSVFVIVLQRNPLVNLPKESTIITFIWPYRKGAPLSRFILPFLKEFIYLFKCGPCQEGKGCLTWLSDGEPFQKNSSLLRTEGKGMH